MEADQQADDGDEKDSLVQSELKHIQETVREKKEAAAHSGWIELFKHGPTQRHLTLALCLPAIQQYTGINAITYCEYLTVSYGKELTNPQMHQRCSRVRKSRITTSDSAKSRQHHIWYLSTVTIS